MATLITGDVIALSTITPDRLAPGLNWDSAGNVTATRFVGDGLQISGLAPGLSSLTVTDALFSITPAHNNAVIYFDNSGGTSVDIPFDPDFQDGHKTTIIQQGAGQVLLTPSNVYSQSGFKRTKSQYSVAELEYLKNSDEWNLFGDLGVGPTYALNASTATVNEGASVTITLNTTLVSNGTLVPYTVAGTITNADLSGSSAGLTGNFSINNNTGSITFFLTGDGVTEGQELINLALNNNEASISVPVIDTSNNSTYSLTRSVSSANEGASVIITLTAPAVPNGTNVPYTVTGINGADLSSGSLTGNFTVNSGTATQTFTFSNDQLTEGNETMVLALNNGAASISVLVLDTSKNPPPQFTQIAGGQEHSLALSGTDLYVTGRNLYGELGREFATIFTKVTIPINAKWTYIDAGLTNSFALSGTDLYATGRNLDGRLGLGDATDRSTFTKVTIPANAKWTAIAAGQSHALALSGTDLYVVGNGSSGKLGLGDATNRSTFTKVTIPTDAKWTAIAAGSFHSLALSGTDLYSTGNSVSLGFGTSVSRSTFTKVTIPTDAKWTAIAAGDASFALSGTDLYVCGYNVYGGLGLGDRNNRFTFTKVNGNWTGISAGDNHALALSGTDLYVAGENVYGALGLGDTAHRSTFTKVAGNWTSFNTGNFNSLALSGTALFGAGFNSYSQLGLGDYINRTTFTQVTAVG